MTDTVTPPQPAPDHEAATRIADIIMDAVDAVKSVSDPTGVQNLARAYIAKCAEVEGLERAYKISETTGRNLFQSAQDATAKWQTAEARAAKLLEALQTFGCHDENCRVHDEGANELTDCDCGLDRAIRAAAKRETV